MPKQTGSVLSIWSQWCQNQAAQVVKHEIRKIGKKSDHREHVKFIVWIFGLVGRAESSKYDLKLPPLLANLLANKKELQEKSL